MFEYYSDTVSDETPRNNEEISNKAWRGILSLTNGLLGNGSLAIDFPKQSDEGISIIGANYESFYFALQAEISDINLDPDNTPETQAILDCIQFIWKHVTEVVKCPIEGTYPQTHIDYIRDKGQIKFREDINLIFRRNQIVYELSYDGNIKRVLDPITEKATPQHTSDSEFNSLLEQAKAKFFDPDPVIHKDSLEKLWDAWERLKTLDTSKNKPEGIKFVLDNTANDLAFRKELEDEANTLTAIGNNFRIRHSETDTSEINDPKQVEYFFHRMYALIKLIVSKNTL